jgi:RimJ/RimL family protein N-acetyltransferase
MTDPIVTQPEIAAERLRLRPLRRGDAGLIALYCGQPRRRADDHVDPASLSAGPRRGLRRARPVGRDDERVWALDTGEDEGNGLIGLLSLRPRPGGEADVGYWVAPAFWGAGYASEAVEAWRAWAAEARASPR